MAFPVTTWLACALGVLYLLLTYRVIQLRYATKVSLGDGGNEGLRRAIRGHANLTETAPLFVLLVLLGEAQGVAIWIIALVAAAFVAGRVLHGICFAYMTSSMPMRSGGMVLTLLAMAAMIVIDVVRLIA